MITELSKVLMKKLLYKFEKDMIRQKVATLTTKKSYEIFLQAPKY